jgi:hypothetical protein
MNHSRKFLTWVYVAAIVVTAYFAPWEKTIHVGEVGLMMVQELDSPLWEIPTIKENQNPGRMPVTRELTQSEIESLKSQGIDPTGLTAAVDQNSAKNGSFGYGVDCHIVDIRRDILGPHRSKEKASFKLKHYRKCEVPMRKPSRASKLSMIAL